jgi:hypothetical protein
MVSTMIVGGGKRGCLTLPPEQWLCDDGMDPPFLTHSEWENRGLLRALRLSIIE